MIRAAMRRLRSVLSKARAGSAPPQSAGGTLVPPPPSVIYIIINRACNLRCKMCNVGQRNRESQFYEVMCPDGPQQLDIEILRKLIAEVSIFAPTIAVTSTEPLLFDDLFMFAGEVREAGMACHVTTNGLLLPKFGREVVESGIESLCISLDGPLDVHNEIRGHPESFQRATEGLTAVDRLAKERGQAIHLCVNYCCSNHNCGALIPFLESLCGLPVESVVISHMNYVTEAMAQGHNALFGHYCRATPSSISGADPVAVDLTALSTEIQQAKHTRWPFALSFSPGLDEEGLRDFYRRPEVVVKARKCAAPWTLAQLAANGDWVVSTRCFPKVMGNLYKATFMDMWHGREYQEFRRWIRDNPMSPACTRCCAVL